MTTDYNEDKSELDFNRRLVAQFEIPESTLFWGDGLSRVSDKELYPPEDSIKDLCASIDGSSATGPAPESLGAFVAAWTSLEQLLISQAQHQEDRILTFRKALHTLRELGQVSAAVSSELEDLRQLRSRAVHSQDIPSDEVLHQATERVERLRRELKDKRQ